MLILPRVRICPFPHSQLRPDDDEGKKEEQIALFKPGFARLKAHIFRRPNLRIFVLQFGMKVEKKMNSFVRAGENFCRASSNHQKLSAFL